MGRSFSRQVRERLFRVPVAGVGGLLIPLAGLVVILDDAFAVPVQHAQIVHGGRVAGVRGLLVPLPRLGVILRHAQAVLVQVAQAVHGDRVTGVGGLLQGRQRVSGVPTS